MSERSFWLRKRKQRSPYLFDGALGVGVGACVLMAFAATVPSAQFPRSPDVPGAVLVAIAWLALVVRRRAPLAAFAVAAAAVLAFNLLDYPDSFVSFAPLIALYTVAAYAPRRTMLVASGVGLAASFVGALALDATSAGERAGQFLLSVILIPAVAAWGDRKQVRAAYQEQLELRAAEKERERLEAAQRAVTAERARIARELHDVVAHAMSVVAVQSGVGAHVIDADPAAAKRMLETISDTSRDALEEMRRLLGVLREEAGEGGDGPELAPAPGLAGLDELAERVTAAGVPVALTITGDRSALPAGVDLAAYRIVQEALTNVLKHAGRARASVEVHCGAEEVRLVVADDGRGADPAALRRPSGHGIVGMRERAELYGGELAVGTRPGGGLLVVAVLHPVAAVPAA